jgi:FADH2 O2-dependent halogenase
MMIDVIIIGGGPAGSTLGCYLSKAGIQHLILEADIHPRPHVGESLVMSTVRTFDEIGFLGVMEDAGFVHKHGASWHEIGGREVSIKFSEFKQAGIQQQHTYHVERARFDMLMLKHAHDMGSEVIQGARVLKVLFDGEKSVGVRVKFADQELDLQARVIVDATGRDTLLGRQLKLKKNDPVFNQYAVHAWFENVDRGRKETEEYIHIYFLPVDRGWAWQIPRTKNSTSIGVVTEREVFKRFNGDKSAFFNHHVKSNQALADALKNANRTNEFMAEGDYSYSMDRLAGDHWVMIGDAARFVDPIFSSGISVAAHSAKLAAEAIKSGFESGDLSADAFRSYEEKIRSGVDIWYEFILLYYKLLPLFTKFIQSEEHRLGILRLLQGEVFDRHEVPVLKKMRKYIETVERTENHIFKDQLSDIPLDLLPSMKSK